MCPFQGVLAFSHENGNKTLNFDEKRLVMFRQCRLDAWVSTILLAWMREEGRLNATNLLGGGRDVAWESALPWRWGLPQLDSDTDSFVLFWCWSPAEVLVKAMVAAQFGPSLRHDPWPPHVAGGGGGGAG